MALFKPGSAAEQLVIRRLAERVFPIVNLQTTAFGKRTASKLEGKQRSDFLRAFPRIAKKALKSVATQKNLAKEKEIEK